MGFTAEIIAVGNEVVSGSVVNSNAAFLSALLTDAGVTVAYHTAVPDDPAAITQAVETARRRASLLVFTGGLGPTCDDLTKTAVAAALGVELTFHPEVEADIRRYFDTVFRREMPLCNLQQAYLPTPCTVFRNPVGTAPGCAFTSGGVTAVLLPGVPSECRHMAQSSLLPWLEQRQELTVRTHELRLFGLTEPQVQELLDDLLCPAGNPSLSPYAQTGEVSLRLTARAADEAACEEKMMPLLAAVRQRLGGYLYGIDVSGLAETALTLCRQRALTLSTAESCTGGLIAKELTDIAGASSVFSGGVVSYTNGVKAGVLGVPQTLLEEYGAVSEPVARAMAEGARRVTGSDLALSVTGLAGPDGDERGNPVGLVYIGLAAAEGTVVQRLMLGGDRERVRILAARHALDILRRYLTDETEKENDHG